MKDSQFPNTEFGNALKDVINASKDFYREYITSDYEGYRPVAQIPKEVAHFWLRQSKIFKGKMLSYYMIGIAADDPKNEIRWMNKRAFRVDDCEEVWLYLHDFKYYVVTRSR